MSDKIEQGNYSQLLIQYNACSNRRYFPSARNAVYGTSARIVGKLGEARGQRGAEPVGRVEVTAEHDHRDPSRPRAFQRGRRRLGAGPGNPGILEEEDAGWQPAPFGIKAARVGVAALPPRPDDQPGLREPQVRCG